MTQKENRIQFNIDFKTGDIKVLKDLKNDLAEIQRLGNDIEFAGGTPAKDIQNMINAARTLDTALDQAFDVKLNAVNVQKFNNILKQSGTSAEQLYTDLSTAGIVGQQAFMKMSGQLMQFNTAIKQSNEFLNGLATTFFNTVKWSIMSSVVNNISGTIQKSFYYIKDLDRGLNDIRIVTGKSADEMERFAVTANDAAKALSVSTEDFTKGALIYYQQGLDDETATQLAEITAKTANVTGQSMEAVSEELTAVWNGYQVANQAAQEGMQVYEEYVDKMAAVGATTASDLEELSVAMSKVASAASAMGVDFDDLNAQIATIVSVTRQAPESVGTALKTIYARLGDLKIDGVDEFGVKLGEVSQQLQDIGINVLDQEGNLRDMSEVIREVATAWSGWTEAQRQAAAVAMAGKRQYNNLIALFDNWNMHEEALATSIGAVGTLSQQQAIAAESLAKKMEKMTATAEDLYSNLFDEESLVKLVEFGTDALQFLADFTESIGGLKNLLPMIGSLGLQVFNEQIGRGLANIVINAQTASRELMTMKQSQQELQAMFSNSAFVADGGNTAALKENVQELFKYYQQMAPYQASMTKEQKEQYNNILNMKVAAGDLAIEVEHEAALWRSKYGYIKLINTGLAENLKDVEALSKHGKKLSEVINQINLEIETGSAVLDDDQTAYEKTLEILRSIKKEAKLSKEEMEHFAKLAQSAFNRNGKDFEAALSEVNTRLAEANTELSNLVNKQNKVDSLDNSFKKLGKTLLQTSQLTKLMSDFTGFAGAAGQLASMVNTFQNLEKVWSNENLTDAEKMTQTVMNLSFVMTSFISTLGTLRKTAFGEFIATQLQASTAALQANTAASSANKVAMDADTAAIFNSITEKELLTVATGENTLAEIIEQKATEKGIGITNIDTKAIEKNTAAKLANAKASAAQTAAENAKRNLASLATTITSQIGKIGIAGIITGIVALIITSIAKAKNAQLDAIEETRKARAEEIASIEEERKQTIEDIEANQKLTQSYIDLYAQYEQGKIGKEQLENASESVIEVLGREAVAVATLTGNYEYLNQKLRETRDKELDAKIAANQQTKLDSLNYVQQNLTGQNIYDKNFSSYSGELDELKALYNGLDEKYRQYLQLNTQKSGHTEQGNISITEEDLNHLDTDFVKALEAAGATNTVLEDAVARVVNNYITAEREQELSQIEKSLSSKNLENIDNYSQYKQILDNAIKQIQNQPGYNDYNTAFDKAMEIISRLSGNNDQYANRAYTEKAVLDKYAKGSNARNLAESMMDTLSDEDLSLIIQGKVQISEKDTRESIRQSLELAKQTFAQEDLSVVSDLMSKIASDKKLTNKELEEALAERNILAKDYADELYDFENRSALEQADILNGIIRDKIAQNQELVDGGIDALKEQMTGYEDAQKRLNELAQRKAQPGGLSGAEQEEQERLSEYIEVTTDDYKLQKDTVENFDINNTVFDSLISGIDGVITEAKILKDLAEDVGENWVVAADDVANFAKSFPEVIEAQESYNFLQDGSLQLTKEGQELFQETINQRKADLIAQNEAYQLQMQKQAAIAKATAEYYTKQADLLEANLKGEIDSTAAKALMEQNLADYKSELMEATGLDDEELTNLINENMALTQTEAADKIGEIYNYWCAVGEAAQNASVAYANGEFEDPGKSNEFSGGTVKVTANKFTPSKRPDDFVFEKDQQMALIEQYRKLANESQNEYSTYESEIAGSQAKLDAAINAMDRAAAGEGGKESKSSSKDAKTKDEKQYKDEFNRYFDIEKTIDNVDRAVKQLEKDQKNLHGKALIASLQKENELIEEQTENYKKLYELQREEASELIGKLKGSGVTFDESGAITNYAEATKAALDQYNAAVAQYNADQNDEVFEIHEKAYENFKKNLERYESLYYKEMKDTQDKIDDNNRKVLENNLKGWEVEIELRLETNKMERDWNNFLRKINKDYKKVFKDLGQEMEDIIAQTGELEKDQKVYLDELEDVTAEIDKMVAGGTSTMFENITQAQEYLKKLYDDILSNGEEIYEQQEKAWDNYLDSIDQAADKFEIIKDGYEKITEELEFQKQLIELVYGEKAYDLFSAYYEGQKGALESQLQSTKAIADTWEKLWKESGATMDNQINWNEDQKKYYEQWQEAQKDLNGLLIEYIELLKEDYLNTVDNILDKLDKKLFGAGGLEEVKQQWEDITWFSEKYLDATEKAYEIETFRNKLNAELDKTDDLKIEQKIQKFRDKEIKQLREKEKLTQYDLDAAEARYQIMLKEIALEEAQNNKTTMKLTRNEQGNWSYQYVADEEDVENKQQELLNAQQDYYELTKKQMNDAYKEWIDMYSAYMETIREIAADNTLDDEARQEKMAKYNEVYTNKLTAISDEYNLARQDSLAATAGVALSVYEQDTDAYANFTEEQKLLTDALVASDITDFMDLEAKVTENFNNLGMRSSEFLAASREDWTATAAQIIEQWNGDDEESIKNQINIAIDEIIDASESYRVKMNEVAESVGYDLGEEGIRGKIKDVETEEERLQEKTKWLTKETQVFLAEQQNYIDAVKIAWGSVETAIGKAIDKINEYLQLQAKAGVSGSVKIDGAINVSDTVDASVSSSKSKSGKNGTGGGGGRDSENVSVYTIRTSDTGEIVAYTESEKKSHIMDSVYDDQYYDSSAYELVNKEELEGAVKYLSGGYTGNQGDDNGRLAVLHKKELVLNKDDTANMLDAVSTLNRMSAINGSVDAAIAESIKGMLLSLAGTSMPNYLSSIGGGTSVGGDTFYIDKLEFPNANSVDEIREAILTLPNIASQFVGRKSK